MRFGHKDAVAPDRDKAHDVRVTIPAETDMMTEAQQVQNIMDAVYTHTRRGAPQMQLVHGPEPLPYTGVAGVLNSDKAHAKPISLAPPDEAAPVILGRDVMLPDDAFASARVARAGQAAAAEKLAQRPIPQPSVAEFDAPLPDMPALPTLDEVPTAPKITGGLDPAMLRPITDALRPGIPDISRLGGGFANYDDPAAMVARVRSIIRRL